MEKDTFDFTHDMASKAIKLCVVSDNILSTMSPPEFTPGLMVRNRCLWKLYFAFFNNPNPEIASNLLAAYSSLMINDRLNTCLSCILLRLYDNWPHRKLADATYQSADSRINSINRVANWTMTEFLDYLTKCNPLAFEKWSAREEVPPPEKTRKEPDHVVMSEQEKKIRHKKRKHVSPVKASEIEKMRPSKKSKHVGTVSRRDQ